MEFSTEVVKKMAEIMVNEMERVGMEQGGIRVVENGCENCCARWVQKHWDAM